MSRAMMVALSLAGPISSAAVYVVYAARNALFGVAWDAESMPKPWAIDRPTLEAAALVIVPAALVLLVARIVKGADRLLVLLCAGVALLLLRELHFEEIALLKKATELAAYLGLPAAIVVGLVWREQVTASPAWPSVKPLLIAAVATYAYSVLVSRRALRFLPCEQAMHIPLEEVAETAGHLLVLAMAACVWSVGARRNGKAPGMLAGPGRAGEGGARG